MFHRTIALAVASLSAVLLIAVFTGLLHAAEPAASGPATAPAAPRWWKGNLHTHSLSSDGNSFPELIAEWYKEHGYHFLAFTDHGNMLDGKRWVNPKNAKAGSEQMAAAYLNRFGRTWVDQRETEGGVEIRVKGLAEFRQLYEEPGWFLLIPGEEMSPYFIDAKGAKVPAHVNAINHRRRLGSPGKGLGSTLEVLQACVDAVARQRERFGQPMIAVLNHPAAAECLAGIQGTKFFDVYNGHPSVGNYDRRGVPGFEGQWDIALALRLGEGKLGPLYGLAVDDAHQHHPSELGGARPGRGWIMVRAERLGIEDLLAAMEAGGFYATTGVCLDEVAFDGKGLHLTIRAEEGVTYMTRFIGTRRGFDRTSTPRLDGKGRPMPYATRIYSKEIGQVLAEAEGTAPAYTLRGDELYVRAKVISSKPKANPVREGDFEVAWTQPVVPSSD